MISINIPGKPIAKKRPRFARRGKFVTTYSDQETEEGKFLMLAKDQIKGEPFHGPIVFCAMFFMPIPKNTPKYKQALASEGKLLHTKKPDLDNLIKFAKDCLNGLAWIDDAQVGFYGTPTGKRYDLNPRTEIRIYEFEEYFKGR